MNERPKISLIEKVLINWVVPIEILPVHIKSKITRNRYQDQSIIERTKAIIKGKTRIYRLLLQEMEKYKGRLPPQKKYQSLRTICGSTRYLVALARRNIERGHYK